jgi:hypothetical protein
MSSLPKNTKATVIPCLRYRDAQSAIEWLCRAFGFEKHLVVPGEGGTIAHAELSFGNGMIMLGSVKKTEFDRLMKQPDEIGGVETQTPVRHRCGCGRALCAGESRRRQDRAGYQGRRLRWARLFMSRSRRAPLEFRHLRSVGT